MQVCIIESKSFSDFNPAKFENFWNWDRFQTKEQSQLQNDKNLLVRNYCLVLGLATRNWDKLKIKSTSQIKKVKHCQHKFYILLGTLDT